MKRYHLKAGEKVWHDGKELVFAYMGQDGHAILHPEGEPDMQSCIGVDPETLVAECKCGCHPGNPGHIPGMLHCVPCCDGQCRFCGKWFIGLAEHNHQRNKALLQGGDA